VREGWRVTRAEVCIVDARGAVVGVILKRANGFSAHSVSGQLGIFPSPSDAVRAIRAAGRGGTATFLEEFSATGSEAGDRDDDPGQRPGNPKPRS